MDKCRICLESKKNLCSIFDSDYGISYAAMLTSVANIQITEDAYKNSICLQCRRKLHRFYNFKKEIERSDLQLNRHLKIIKFNNFDEVKAQVIEEIQYNDKNITCDKDDNYRSLFENSSKSIFYNNIVITKFFPQKNCLDKNEATSDIHLEIPPYKTNNDYIDRHDDSVTCDYNLLRRQIRKKKMNVADVKNPLKCSSNSKKVCIKPIVLNNIKIISSNRKKNKKHNKHRKRLEMCAYCGKMCSNVKTHILVHIGEKNYKCSECNKAFFSSTQLNYHKTKHLTRSIFKCDHCVAVFNTKGSLQSHMASHTDVKNHVCSICNKAFKRKNALARHMLIHDSTGKSVKCELCNMSFLYKQGLRHHMRVHTGERPYKCEMCSQPYSYKHDFNRHCLKKHGVFLKHRSVFVMNEEVLMQERAIMKDLMLRVQGVVKGEPLNPFQGPHAKAAYDEAVKALESSQIPIDML